MERSDIMILGWNIMFLSMSKQRCGRRVWQHPMYITCSKYGERLRRFWIEELELRPEEIPDLVNKPHEDPDFLWAEIYAWMLQVSHFAANRWVGSNLLHLCLILTAAASLPLLLSASTLLSLQIVDTCDLNRECIYYAMSYFERFASTDKDAGTRRNEKKPPITIYRCSLPRCQDS